MRRIKTDQIKRAVSQLCIEANISLRKDILSALKKSLASEKKPLAKEVLRALIENARLARNQGLPICQDTGMVAVFVQLGQEVRIAGGDLTSAINRGINDGYKRGYLRESIVGDPLRRDSFDNVPAVIHIDIVRGPRLKIILSPRGFGAENTSQTKMLKPTDGIDEVKRFVTEVVKEAGPGACPPFIIGVGIGGTFEKAALLSKQALLRPIDRAHPTKHIARLENELLTEINRLGIGPMGFGGKTTTLGVNILTYPTHIAGLPVAVNISCHALRSATKKL